MNINPPNPLNPADEAAFLASYDASQFSRPSVAVDVVLLTVEHQTLRVLLLRRTEHPFVGRWSLPGGFLAMNESLEDTALRVLRAKAKLRRIFLEQLYTFGEPHRDPRTRVISVAHFALVPAEVLRGALLTDDSLVLAQVDTPWEGEAGGPVQAFGPNGQRLPLAFDHALMLGTAVKRLRGRLDYSPVGYEFLPPEFTLRALQSIHETIRGHTVNKDAFRRRMLATGDLEPTGSKEPTAAYRPAELYRFRRHQ